jgi:hypothetical protein
LFSAPCPHLLPSAPRNVSERDFSGGKNESKLLGEKRRERLRETPKVREGNRDHALIVVGRQSSVGDYFI